MTFRTGTASRIINCEIGDDIAGQCYRRTCKRIRDDLEANLLYLADARERILLVSLDLLALPDAGKLCAAVEAKTGIPARNVIITATHTHAGPDVFGFITNAPKNETYLKRLCGRLVDAAEEAIKNARPARVGWALGHAHIGYNRRLCRADGAHTMYGDSSRPEFTGIEGPDDPSHAILAALDMNGNYIAILHNNCCHATCMEGQCFASADFPGEARRLLREALGPNLPVLYLQGASGDISPWNMMKTPFHYDVEQRIREIGALLAGETLRLLHEVQPIDGVILRHACEDLPVDVRMPTKEQLQGAREAEALGEKEVGEAQYAYKVSAVLRLYEEFKNNPKDTAPVHAVRIGDFAIATNPCELYCRFGLDIKQRSPAKITAIAQLTDGWIGYCPTIYGLLGGGYSGETIYWCRLEPYAGYKIVEASARLLHEIWKG